MWPPVEERIIIDISGGTGGWSRSYHEAGYRVIIVDPAEDLEHGPDGPEHVRQDIRDYTPPPDVWGVLAAPPCTHFAGSGAQYWPVKDRDGRTLDALSIVYATLDVIKISKPKWWSLENPVGRLRRYIGAPVMYFHPCDYGDPYTKKTCLWGDFNVEGLKALKTPVEPEKVCSQGSWVMRLGGSSDRTKRLRSVTPPGFERAFFQANP